MANMAMRETMTRDNAYRLTDALSTLKDVMGDMLVATSGFNKRCFLPAEQVVFDAIRAATAPVAAASTAAFKLRALEATAVKN